MSKLSKSEIMRIVNRYIGVSGGYLGDFSYRTHGEFYAEYCDLDLDPFTYLQQGTTRERFIVVLEAQPTEKQAAILRGVLEKFPVGGVGSPATRTIELRTDIEGMIRRLEGASPIRTPTLGVSIEVVNRALADAEALLQSTGAQSAVDRLHTAVHGYVIGLCRQAGITVEPDANMTALFKSLRETHPALSGRGARSEDVTKVCRALASILDALNPVRNKASVAHPNDQLLERPEAMLVINTAKTLLHYLNDRIPPAQPSLRAPVAVPVVDDDVPF